MGKRLIKTRILYPITDGKQLEKRYDMVDKMREKNVSVVFSKILSDICDIEKKHRRINLQKLSPAEFYMLTFSYTSIIELLKITQEYKFYKVTQLTKLFTSFYTEYNRIFDVFSMKDIPLTSIKNSFFNNGIYPEIDDINNEILDRHAKLDKIALLYSSCISKNRSGVKVIKNDGG